MWTHSVQASPLASNHAMRIGMHAATAMVASRPAASAAVATMRAEPSSTAVPIAAPTAQHIAAAGATAQANFAVRRQMSVAAMAVQPRAVAGAVAPNSRQIGGRFVSAGGAQERIVTATAPKANGVAQMASVAQRPMVVGKYAPAVGIPLGRGAVPFMNSTQLQLQTMMIALQQQQQRQQQLQLQQMSRQQSIHGAQVSVNTAQTPAVNGNQTTATIAVAQPATAAIAATACAPHYAQVMGGPSVQIPGSTRVHATAVPAERVAPTAGTAHAGRKRKAPQPLSSDAAAAGVSASDAPTYAALSLKCEELKKQISAADNTAVRRYLPDLKKMTVRDIFEKVYDIEERYQKLRQDAENEDKRTCRLGVLEVRGRTTRALSSEHKTLSRKRARV